MMKSAVGPAKITKSCRKTESILDPLNMDCRDEVGDLKGGNAVMNAYFNDAFGKILLLIPFFKCSLHFFL